MDECYDMYQRKARDGATKGLVRPDTVRIILRMSWRDAVRRLMDEQDLVQEDLCHVFGIDRAGVGHRLTGIRKTSVEEFFALAKYLGVTAQELFEDDEPEPPPFDPTSCAGIELLQPRDRRCLQAVIRAFVAAPTWDKKTERRNASKRSTLCD